LKNSKEQNRMNARLTFIHALSPLHAGTGQGVGAIDMPVAREKATGLPILPGSSLKGPLRDVCRETYKSDPNNKTCVKIFGPETDNASEHAGAVQFSDQRLLLLPIRSLAGTFAWVSSPYLLRRFIRDAHDADHTDLPQQVPPFASTATQAVQQCIVTSDSVLTLSNDAQQVYLEDLDLHATTQETATEWARWLGTRIFAGDQEWQQMLTERFCMVHDDVLSFLLNTATEITARIRLKDETKTVAQGGLWYEEALPTETVLAGLVVATPVKHTGLDHKQIFDELGKFANITMQFGGKATVGRGLCRLQMTAEGA
jgi:CRISPR-associated protein Cmr4